MFAEDFFRQSGVLVALHVAKRLVGIKKVSRDELAKVAKEKAALEIILQSACRVQGQIDSTGLRERKLPLWCNADVDYDGRPCFSFVSEKQEFEFFLPPGTFEIEADAGYCHRTTQRITIDPEQRELKMMFDLPLTRMAKLIGQPAPELRDVVAWKNSKPLTLADLRGKYVLLDFWGYWCGPCVHQMPELFVRHDRFAKYGLVVIGVHVDAAEGSVDTVAKLDAKLDGIRQSVWQGRDLPFPVALVSPKKTKYEGTEKFARCAASADFGVTGYPTCVLIDREGRVVDTIGFGQKEDERLAKLLGVGKRELPSTLHVR
ncbi:MAG: TlpA family protein disulfide reductase [Thermoguttaceae bacterium]